MIKFTVIHKKSYGTWQFGTIGVLVNFITQKLKSKHLVCPSFLLWSGFFWGNERKYFKHIPDLSLVRIWKFKIGYKNDWLSFSMTLNTSSTTILLFKIQITLDLKKHFCLYYYCWILSIWFSIQKFRLKHLICCYSNSICWPYCM